MILFGLSCILLSGCGTMSSDEAIKDIKHFRSPSFCLLTAHNMTNAKIRGVPYIKYDDQLKEINESIKIAEGNIKHLKENMSEYKKVNDKNGNNIYGYAYNFLWENEAELGYYKTLKKRLLVRKELLAEYEVSYDNNWYNPKYQRSLISILSFEAEKKGEPYGQNNPFWSINPRDGYTRARIIPFQKTKFLVSVCECSIEHDNDYTIISPVVRLKNIGTEPYRMAYDGMRLDKPDIRLVLANREFAPDENSFNMDLFFDRKHLYGRNEDKEYLNPNEEIFIYDKAFKVPYYLEKTDVIQLEFYCSSVFRKDNHITLDAIPDYKQDYAIICSPRILSNQYNVDKPVYKKYIPMKFLLDDKEFPMVYTGDRYAYGEATEIYLALPTLQVLNYEKNYMDGYGFHAYFNVISKSGDIETYNLKFEYDKTGNKLETVLDLGENKMPGVAPLLDLKYHPHVKNVGKIIRDIYRFEKLDQERKEKEGKKK